MERGEEETDGRWSSGARPPVPPSQGGGRYDRERGRSTGGEFIQPTYHRPHLNHHPHPPPASSHFFSQPGEPEMKSTRAFSQVDHAPHHTHSLSRKRVDVMTGEHRQFRGPAHFFAPNLPSHHRHRGTQHHHDNVELIGHKSLRATRSHGYGTEYGNETAPHRQIPYSRIGMEAPANGLPHSPTDNSPVYWEVCLCVPSPSFHYYHHENFCSIEIVVFYFVQSLSPAEQKRQRVNKNNHFVIFNSHDCTIVGTAEFGGGRVHVPFPAAEWNRDLPGPPAASGVTHHPLHTLLQSQRGQF